MCLWIFIAGCFLSSFEIFCQHFDNCGQIDGAVCSAQPGRVTWKIKPEAWAYRKSPETNCAIEGVSWKCHWEDLELHSVYLALAPCLDFPKGHTWSMEAHLAVNLAIPKPERSLKGFPGFTISIGLIAQNQEEPLAVERFDLSAIRHDKWQWNWQKNIALSVKTENFNEDIHCAHIALWYSNRLKRSQLSGAIEIKDAAIVILHDHPKPNFFNLKLVTHIHKGQELLLCTSMSAFSTRECRHGRQDMSCEASNLAYQTGCSVKEGYVGARDSAYNALVFFHVEYLNTCTGTPLSIGILTDKNSRVEFMANGKSNTIKFQGHGPITFRDFNGAEYTSRATLIKPCSIRILHFDIRGEEENEDF